MSNFERTERARIRLLTSAMHNLVIHATGNLECQWVGGMTNNSIPGSVATNTVDLDVVDTVAMGC